MKIKNIKYLACAAVLGLGLTSCSDFLDRPTEDSYNTDNYYTSDAACISGVNYLYNSPWYDFQRGFIKVGEVFSGNMYWGSSPYLNFSVNGTDEDLINMSYSLWAEIGHCNTVYSSLGSASASAAVIQQCQGECLVWKAMAYFYLVRTFGDVPIIHDSESSLASEEYKTCSKVEKADVYDYIVLTLDKAIKLLEEAEATQTATTGHIDQWGAKGLLAKVYLQKAGVTGTLDNSDLDNACSYALEVINHCKSITGSFQYTDPKTKVTENTGLLENYADVFRGSNNISSESLIAWRWTVGSHWTCQNTLQSDLAIVGFDENGDVWGGWGGPSLDLINAFGVDPRDDPNTRIDIDSRRKATCMLAGDQYSYFWRDKTAPNGFQGFDYIEAIYDTETDYGKTFSEGQCQGPCGSNNVKHLYGDNADHQAEMGMSAGRMANALATHLLRLSDVYLIYAEAAVLNTKANAEAKANALKFYNIVRSRAVKSYDPSKKTEVTFDDIWKERRLEFAGEGDRWYDFVRRSYYDVNACIAEIKAQKRNALWNCNALYKAWYESGRKTWDTTAADVTYDESTAVPNVTANSFSLPFPTEDVAQNANLGSNVAPVHVDVSKTYSY